MRNDRVWKKTTFQRAAVQQKVKEVMHEDVETEEEEIKDSNKPEDKK